MSEKQTGTHPASPETTGGANDQNPRGSRRGAKFAIVAACVAIGIAMGVATGVRRYFSSGTGTPIHSAQSPLGSSEPADVAEKAPAQNGRSYASVIPGQTAAVPTETKRESHAQEAAGAKPAPAVATNTAPTAVPKGCFEESFTHKAISSHADGEACLQHQNLVTLALSGEAFATALEHPGKFQSSLCVRVNGKPVTFKMNPSKPNEIMIPALAGPESTIRIRYCTGNTKCTGKQSGCAVPKDDFLASLGAAGGIGEDFDDLTAAAPNEAWGEGKNSRQEKQAQANIDRQLASAKKVFEAARKGKTKVFKDWLAQGDAAPACQFQTQSTTGTKE
jgi:hypothetical protein